MQGDTACTEGRDGREIRYSFKRGSSFRIQSTIRPRKAGKSIGERHPFAHRRGKTRKDKRSIRTCDPSQLHEQRNQAYAAASIEAGSPVVPMVLPALLRRRGWHNASANRYEAYGLTNPNSNG